MLKKLVALMACAIALAVAAAPPALASPQMEICSAPAPSATVADAGAEQFAPAVKVAPMEIAAEKREGSKEDQGADGRRKGTAAAHWRGIAPPHTLRL